MSQLRQRIEGSAYPPLPAAGQSVHPPPPAGAEPAGAALPPGTTLNGVYVIDARIAQGGMGEVYSGRSIATGDRVAIKMVLPEHSRDELIVSLFRKEASTLHNLTHDAIVRYYLFSIDPVLARPYLVMEFASGPSLGAYLRQNGPLSAAEATTLRRRVAGGLDAAHRIGIFHRDISPDNIILVDGDVRKAKLIDFGIAKQQNSDVTLIGTAMAGKLNYMSPEQLGMNGGTVTARSDIYSFGLVLAEAASGRPLPMTGSQLDLIEKRRAVPDLDTVPDDLRALIERMLSPDPARRPATMAEVAAWNGGDPEADEQTRVVTQLRPRRRSRGMLVFGALAATVGLGVAGYFGQLPGWETVIAAVPAAPDQPRERRALLAVQDAVEAPLALVSQRYEWTTRSFAYNGALEEMIVRPIGVIPPGLAFEHGSDGVSRIAGVPKEAGVFSFLLDAESPEGLVAEQVVILKVQ
ncbi:MAG: serine/threonine-protein kinase [Pseudomonadota bacterium]